MKRGRALAGSVGGALGATVAYAMPNMKVLSGLGHALQYGLLAGVFASVFVLIAAALGDDR